MPPLDGAMITEEWNSRPVTSMQSRQEYEDFDEDKNMLMPLSNSFEMIVETLLPFYRRTLNLPSLTPTEHFVVDAKGTEKHARRIAYAIKVIYGIEFHFKVVLHLEPTVERMAERIQEARVVLAPSFAKDQYVD